jgi:hypothetical protein
MKKISIILTVLLNSIILRAQVDICKNVALEMRYWKLRGQLRGDERNLDVYNGLLSVGESSGQSLPADALLQAGNKLSIWQFYNDLDGKHTAGGCAYQYNSIIPWQIPNNPGFDNFPLDWRQNNTPLKGAAVWLDNPLITLGSYIAVLASEWKLLKTAHGSTLQTEKELFFALQAIERLDKNAELQYGSTGGVVNGFLMRDDVPENFALTTMGSNIDLVISHVACGAPDMVDDPTKEQFANCGEIPYCLLIGGGSSNIGSIGVNCDHLYQMRHNVASGDELIGILYGFCFIKKYVDDNVTFNGENLLNKAQNITKLILNNLKKHQWWIVDPFRNRPVCRGSTAFAVSYGLAKMGQFITGNSFNDNTSTFIGKQLVWQIVHAFWANNTTTEIKMNMPVPTYNPPFNFNWTKLDITLPIGGGHTTKEHLDYNMINYLKMASVTKIAAFYPGDWKGKYFIKGLAEDNGIPIYDLIGSEFTGYKAHFDRVFWEQELLKNGCNSNCWQTVLPNQLYYGCGNFENDENNIIHDPWNFINRWEHGSDIDLKESIRFTNDALFVKNRTIEDIIEKDGNRMQQYNGLDYMLAFNLYRLHFFDEEGGTFDKIRRKIDVSFPMQADFYPVGSDALPYKGKAVFSIDSKSKINSDGNAAFEAGSDINFKRGFYAEQGSVLKANIKRYDCTPTCEGGFVLGRTTSNITPEAEYEVLDTTLADLEEDTTLLINDDEANYIDTNIWVIQLVNDTFFVSLNPLYKFDSLGNIVPNTSPRFMQSSNQGFNIVRVYPNPAADIINVNYFLPSTSNVSITIFNAIGEIVKFEKIDNFVQGVHQHSYNISGFSNGFYNLELNINGVIKNYKFVKVNK